MSFNRYKDDDSMRVLRILYLERKRHAVVVLEGMLQDGRVPDAWLAASASAIHQVIALAPTFGEAALGQELKPIEHTLRNAAAGDRLPLVERAYGALADEARDLSADERPMPAAQPDVPESHGGAERSPAPDRASVENGIETEQQGDRRREHRYQAVYIPALVSCGDITAFGVVRNVSHNGARLRAPIALTAGDRITYCVDEKNPIEATVAWVRGDDFGVSHDRRSEKFPLARPSNYRAARLKHKEPLAIYRNGIRYQGVLLNLSQGGACVHTAGPIVPGDLITIVLRGRQLENVTVRWGKRDRFGIEWSKALGQAELNEIVASAWSTAGGERSTRNQ